MIDFLKPRLKQAVVSGAFLLLLSACGSQALIPSTEVETSETFQSFVIEIDPESDLLRITAEFSKNSETGNSIQLIEPSRIELNSESLEESIAGNRATYQTERSLSLSDPTLQFIWFTNESEQILNEITLPEVSVTGLPTSLNRGESLEVSWTGGSLQENEEISVRLLDERSIGITKTSTDVGRENLQFAASDMTALTSGILRVQVTRTKQSNLQNTSAAGGIFTTVTSSLYSLMNLQDSIGANL